MDNTLVSVYWKLSNRIDNGVDFAQLGPEYHRGSGQVKIIIYNTLGQEMAILLDELQNLGVKGISFNGENYCSEVYFVVMQTGQFQAKRKIVLLK
ncbi:hypothetical protein HQ531_00060 [bacterium]|nr:hypothetical protein [bacterium]